MPRPQTIKRKNAPYKEGSSKVSFSDDELAAIAKYYPEGGSAACMPYMHPKRSKSDVSAAANARGIYCVRYRETAAKRKAAEAARKESPDFKPRRSFRRVSVEVPSQRTVTKWEPVKPEHPASVFNLAK